MAVPTLNLGVGLETALASGHPWIYRNHLPRNELVGGEWVHLVAGRSQAFGLYDADGAIGVRLFARDAVPDRAALHRRVTEALALRSTLTASSAEPGGTNAYRVLNGEGDYLPGITADRYGRFVVMRAYASSVSRLLPELARHLSSALPGLKGVVEHGEGGLTPLWGSLPPPEESVRENGLRFVADPYRGMKGGLFLDQRENRNLVRALAADKDVLNLFAYTGTFGTYALAGGARSVLDVDVAESAVAEAARAAARNGLDVDRQRAMVADVFELLPKLAERGRRFGLVVLDPPSLARRAEQRRRAQRAYLRLNRWAFALVEPGGLLATSSCTAQVSPESFQRVVGEAALAAGVRAQLIAERGQASDHPVPAGFPEGRYLKFLVYRVLAA